MEPSLLSPEEQVDDPPELPKREQAKIERHRALLAETAPAWWLQCCGWSGGAGVAWWSPAGLWFVLVRLVMALTTFYEMYAIIIYLCQMKKHHDQEFTFVFMFAFRVPFILSLITAQYAGYGFLGHKFDEAMTNNTRAPIEPQDIDKAARRSSIFVVFWMVYSIAITVVWATSFDNPPIDTTRDVVQCLCTTPTLGAILFTLSLDVSRACKHIAFLAEGARDQTLSVEQYRQERESIHVIEDSWNAQLWALAGVAAYNMAGMPVIIYYVQYIKPTWGGIWYDFYVLATQGTEMSLLFVFTYLARLINDDSDDVLADVFQWRPGERSESEVLHQEVRRTQVIIEGAGLSIVSPRDRANRTTMCRRIFSERPLQQIQFRVLGIRWTSTYVQSLIVTYVVSLISVSASKLLGHITT